MTQHSRLKHGGRKISHCAYCRKAFSERNEYDDHMKILHGLPSWDAKGYSGPLPTSAGIKGNLKTVKLPAARVEQDFLEYVMDQKPNIDKIVDKKTKVGPQKVQLVAHITMRKESEDEEEEAKEIDFFINSDMLLIYPSEGLSEDQFNTKLDRMMNRIFSFTSNGSGWRFRMVNSFEVKLARFAPIRHGTYIALPTKFQSERSLLNIRNPGDPNCFLYCFTAAYHNHFGPSL